MWTSFNTLDIDKPFEFPNLPKGTPYSIPHSIGDTDIQADHAYANQANYELSKSLGFTVQNDLNQAQVAPLTLNQMKVSNTQMVKNMNQLTDFSDNSNLPMPVDSYKDPLNIGKIIESFGNKIKNKLLNKNSKCGDTYSYGSSLEAPILTPGQLGAKIDYQVHQNKLPINAMNNMNQNAMENQNNFVSNAMFYTNTTNTSGNKFKHNNIKGSTSTYVIGNGIEAYDDRLKFEESSLVTNSMRRMNENYHLGKDFNRVNKKNGLNEHNQRVTFVDPKKSKKLFQEQLRRLGESDITLAEALEIQKAGGNYLENKPIQPVNSHPQMFDNAEFVSDTKTPFSRSIGIHPVKRHAYQPKKNVLTAEGHFELSSYNPSIDYNRNYVHGLGYAPSNIDNRKSYTIDFKKYKPSKSMNNVTGNMNKMMYDTNFKHMTKGFKPHDQSPNINFLGTGSEYSDAYGSCY